ncbi:MAG: hypothetical protein KDA79_16465, partial [Planctomycetaceae bacterium]|nr:hypothetical protein [Planctomycetaceae bacterium]
EQPAAEDPGQVIDISTLKLPEVSLVDALNLPVEQALGLLSTAGLAEAALMLRTPSELSDGQRYRFRLALALSRNPRWIIADEFTATLDRHLAQVIAFNLRRLASRTGTGFLLATTHEDILTDLQPDLHIRPDLDGRTTVTRHASKKKRFSLAHGCHITRATRADWPYFARWHYRSHRIGILRFATLLWHDTTPVGICLFTSAPHALTMRNRFFGHRPRWSRTALRLRDRQLVMLSRIVIHPAWRGAGIATDFVRASCRLCPWPWIETLTQMGHINPFFERAGFTRVGAVTPPETRRSSRTQHSAIYGKRPSAHAPRRLLSPETHRKSRYAAPVYYILDNRQHTTAPSGPDSTTS